MIKLMQGDCTKRIKEIPSESIDLTITSPPYDNLREYNGNNIHWGEHIWKKVIDNLFRVTTSGGVVVWIVNDAVIKGSETGTSFKQALYAMECGFLLHDTMIWRKDSFSNPFATRYHQVFEYMFVFSKGKPRFFNGINDRKNKHYGKISCSTVREADGSLHKRSPKTIKEFGKRFNVWDIPLSRARNGHPAVFPIQLASDHIISWSDEQSVVLDPFMGSGTTGVAAKKLRRDFIGIELDKKYFKIANNRINENQSW